MTRLRFALDDQRCVICQQQLPAVFVTRFMGAYTSTIPAAEFAQLKVLQALMPIPKMHCLRPPCALLHGPAVRMHACCSAILLQSNMSHPQERPGVYHLVAAEAYFDDKQHYDSIRTLCSYTHPELPDSEARRPCRSLRELKQLLAASRQLQFCDICLEGRKVSCALPCIYGLCVLHQCCLYLFRCLSWHACTSHAGYSCSCMSTTR